MSLKSPEPWKEKFPALPGFAKLLRCRPLRLWRVIQREEEDAALLARFRVHARLTTQAQFAISQIRPVRSVIKKPLTTRKTAP